MFSRIFAYIFPGLAVNYRNPDVYWQDHIGLPAFVVCVSVPDARSRISWDDP